MSPMMRPSDRRRKSDLERQDEAFTVWDAMRNTKPLAVGGGVGVELW